MLLEVSREISNSVTVTYSWKRNSSSESVLFLVAPSVANLHKSATNGQTDRTQMNLELLQSSRGFVSETAAQLQGGGGQGDKKR